MRFENLIDLVRAQMPGLLAFLGDNNSDQIRQIARQAEQQNWDPQRFLNTVQNSDPYRKWSQGGSPLPQGNGGHQGGGGGGGGTGGGGGGTGGGGGGGGGGGTPPPPAGPPGDQPGGGTGGTGTPPPIPTPFDDWQRQWDIQQQDIQRQNQASALDTMQTFLNDYGLPATLLTFIKDAVQQNMSASEIIARLRQTPEYKAAFPENDLRKANGFDWMPEAQILAYRSEARRIAQATLGVTNVSNQQIADLISKNKSLAEWEQNLQTYKTFERWGPTVKNALSQELGFDVSDDRVFAFMSADIPTPELDQAYQKALMRGQPAVLGFGMRPEEEANILMQYGIDPQQAFQGYQGVAGELPRAERLARIQAHIEGQDNLPSAQDALGDSSFGLLFRAIQLRDPDAMQKLSNNMAAEVARFQAGGSVAYRGTQAVGLLARGQEQ